MSIDLIVLPARARIENTPNRAPQTRKGPLWNTGWRQTQPLLAHARFRLTNSLNSRTLTSATNHRPILAETYPRASNHEWPLSAAFQCARTSVGGSSSSEQRCWRSRRTAAQCHITADEALEQRPNRQQPSGRLLHWGGGRIGRRQGQAWSAM